MNDRPCVYPGPVYLLPDMAMESGDRYGLRSFLKIFLNDSDRGFGEAGSLFDFRFF